MLVKNLMFFLIILCLPSFSQAQTINPERSSVVFSISNIGVNTVKGSFTGMDGTIIFNIDDPGSANFDVCIDASTVNTGNDKRDKHLRNEDYFDVEKYPTICYTSSSVVQTTAGFVASGVLTLHGVSKEADLPFTFKDNTFTGTIQIMRKDYNIGPNGGFMVGKKVDLEIICVLE